MAITSGLTLLQKLQKLFGARAVSDMMGQTTNVQTLAKGTNNPFANTFSSKYLAKNKDGVEEASKVIIENMQYAFGNKNARQMKNFENNVDTLYNIKFPQKNTGTKQAEILDLKTKKPVTEEGIASLKTDLGLPEDVSPNSPLGELLLEQRRLKKQLNTDMRNVMKKEELKKTKGDIFMDITKASAKPVNIEREGQVRTASREFLNRELKLGKIKLKPEETKSILQPSGGGTDPIDILRTYYGEDVLDALDNLAPKFMQAEKYSDYIKIMDNNLDKSFFKPRKDPSIRQSYTDDEMRDIVNKKEDDLGDKLKNLPDDIDPDAMAQGGIAGQLHLNQGGRVGLQEGGMNYDYPVYDPNELMSFTGSSYEDEYSPEELELLRTIPVSDFNMFGGMGPIAQKVFNQIKIRRGEPTLNYYRGADNYLRIGEKPTTAAPTTQSMSTAAPTLTTQPTSTGIQTIPDNKFAVNVMMNEQGNVADDQGMAELARETGIAPSITNLPINNMSDVMRMIGPGDDISEGTGYNMPPPSVEQRMQEAADKGLDARMGRTYEENVQAMADPRMRAAYGGRIGFKNGGMDRRAFLKLMGGLASLPVVGKFFKGAKVASKIPMLKNTTTTMPAWFPDLVDKFVAKGVGKKIDKDIMEYTTKELPGIKLTKSDDGRIIVEGQNDYYRSYDMEYQPPGYEVIDQVKGKAVKTKGDFTASEEVPVNMDPDGNVDFDGEILESVDDILTSDARTMEEFATGRKISFKEKKYRGESRVGEAEVRLENEADAYREQMAEEADEFAKGGLAGQLL